MLSQPMPMQRRLAPKPTNTEHQRPLSRVALFTLPNILLWKVICCLDQNTLAHLVLVCSQLRTFATPALYRVVTVKPGKLMSFTGTILRTPCLLEYVRSLTVHDHNTIESRHAELLERAIARMQNLRQLIIKGRYTQFDWVPVEMVLRHRKLYATALRSPFLVNLEQCTLSLGQGDPWDMADRECIFAHPNIRKLSIIGAAMSDFHSFTERLRRTSPLQSLALHCCDLSPITLQKILSVPRNLCGFTYGGARQVGEPLYTSPHHDRYIAAMHVQADSLTSIAFSPWNFKSSEPRLFDFHRFTSLRLLAIMPFLIPVQYPQPNVYNITPLAANWLPASLIYLTVLHRDARIISYVENRIMRAVAVNVRSGSLPSLRLVTFSVPLETQTSRGGHNLPHEWHLYFHGRVHVARTRLLPAHRQPLDCECCDFDLFKFVVDNRVVDFHTLPCGFHVWLLKQLAG